MKDPTPQALKAAEKIAYRWSALRFVKGTIAHDIDREAKLPELLEVAQQARELCKVLYIGVQIEESKLASFSVAAGQLNDALGRLDNPKKV